MIPSCSGGLVAIAMDSPPIDVAAAPDAKLIPSVEPLKSKEVVKNPQEKKR
jgi:hypothetical protein